MDLLNIYSIHFTFHIDNNTKTNNTKMNNTKIRNPKINKTKIIDTTYNLHYIFHHYKYTLSEVDLISFMKNYKQIINFSANDGKYECGCPKYKYFANEECIECFNNKQINLTNTTNINIYL